MTIVKIAVPVETRDGIESALSEHFGRSGGFAVFDYGEGEVVGLQFIENKRHPAVEPVSNAEFLAGSSPDVLLAGSIGPHMLTVLLERGVRVYSGAKGTIRDALDDYEAGRLAEARMACGLAQYHYHGHSRAGGEGERHG